MLNGIFKSRRVRIAALVLGGFLLVVGTTVGAYVAWKAYGVLVQYRALNEQVRDKKFIRFYFNELSAFLRYELYGDATEKVAVFAAQAKKFVEIEDVAVAKFCPPERDYARRGGFLFSAARIFMLPDADGDGLPDILATSYLGAKNFLHKEQSFSSVILSSSIPETLGRVTRLDTDSGLAQQWLDRRPSTELLVSSYYRPFGYNAADFDGDQLSDFVFGDELYVSSSFSIAPPKIEIPRDGIHRVGRDSVFLRLGGETLLVSLAEGEFLIRRWNEEQDGPVVVKRHAITSDAADSVAPFKLYPLPDLDGDGREEFALIQSDRIEIYTTDEGLDVRLVWTIDGVDTLSQIGGFGDYDRDGLGDFWIAQRVYEVDGRKIGRAVLITAKRLADNEGSNRDIDQLKAFELLGAADFTDVFGIGATLSLESGDLDGDSIPDFSVSGHRHLNEAGALYIVLGKDIVPGGRLVITDPSVVKLRGSILAQLAPPHVHWDATDYTGDGIDDIVVSADGDFCTGFASGAIYIVDGAKLLDRWRDIRPNAAP